MTGNAWRTGEVIMTMAADTGFVQMRLSKAVAGREFAR